MDNYLALSGISQGVRQATIKGNDVIIENILQSATYKANHGSMTVAIVKKIAMDMFATKVRHFGPTYSKTRKFKKTIFYMKLRKKFLFKNRGRGGEKEFSEHIPKLTSVCVCACAYPYMCVYIRRFVCKKKKKSFFRIKRLYVVSSNSKRREK